MHILLVEDHADTLALLSLLLADEGHSVTAAAPRAEARAALAAGPRPGAAVVDLWLPDGEGYELAPDLAAAGVPAVAFSGLAYPADVARSLASGFAIHLAKPAGVAEILAAIAVAANPPSG